MKKKEKIMCELLTVVSRRPLQYASLWLDKNRHPAFQRKEKISIC